MNDGFARFWPAQVLDQIKHPGRAAVRVQMGGIFANVSIVAQAVDNSPVGWPASRRRRLQNLASVIAVMRDFAPDQDAVHASQATAGTIATYDRIADAFCNGTANHDVSQNINALLEAVKGEAPYIILDFGCGPGRDLRRFTELGHKAVGLDGSSQFVKIARIETGCEVLHQDFIRLSLPSRRFDGIFANASLFHIPSGQLHRVLKELAASLKPGGVLVSSNPRGSNEEGWVDGRYGCFHDLETWCSYVTEAGFEQLHHYYRPAGQPRENQPWLVTVWRVRTQASMNDDFQLSAETED